MFLILILHISKLASYQDGKNLTQGWITEQHALFEPLPARIRYDIPTYKQYSVYSHYHDAHTPHTLGNDIYVG